jgi:hypothetical protein
MIEVLYVLKFIFREEWLEFDFGVCSEAGYVFDEEIEYINKVPAILEELVEAILPAVDILDAVRIPAG